VRSLIQSILIASPITRSNLSETSAGSRSDINYIVCAHQECFSALLDTPIEGVESDLFGIQMAPGISRVSYIDNASVTKIQFTPIVTNDGTRYTGLVTLYNDKSFFRDEWSGYPVD
jgi:hypothetical protein